MLNVSVSNKHKMFLCLWLLIFFGIFWSTKGVPQQTQLTRYKCQNAAILLARALQFTWLMNPIMTSKIKTTVGAG